MHVTTVHVLIIFVCSFCASHFFAGYLFWNSRAKLTALSKSINDTLNVKVIERKEYSPSYIQNTLLYFENQHLIGMLP